MAVSAYASLVSLTHVLHNLHYRAHFQLPRADLKLVELLQENVYFLLEFVEGHSKRKSPEIEGLWRQIVEVAFGAEDTINFHVVNQLHMSSEEETSDAGFLAFCEGMETLIQKFCYIKEKLPVIKVEGKEAKHLKRLKRPDAFLPVGGSSAASLGVKKVIGFDEHVDTIMDKLIGGERKLQVFPITGMAGIGKTTLARTVFYHPHIVEYFDLRIWLTISQDYTIEQILMGLLEEGNIVTCQSVVKSGDELYQKLFGRRYLIVLDDVWTTEALDDLRIFFPDKENGSRIILTTRLFDVAVYLGFGNPYKLNFLDKDKSWDLFCATAFGQVGCPYPNLEKIGKAIVKCCKGLPLEIAVIGQSLANSNMDQEYWEFVAENINSLGNLEDYEHCLKVCSLSYENLPIHLKPCFLFMRAFPEDANIKVPDLVDKWIAEGFIKHVTGNSLEEAANVFLKELIDRNLIFRRSEKECGIHDLLRDLCFRESNNEHFIRSPRVQCTEYHNGPTICVLCSEPVEENSVVHFPQLVHICASSSQFTVLVCDTCKILYSHITRPIIVKTMDSRFFRETKEIIQPTELRHYSHNNSGVLQWVSPPTLHLLWNLQFLYLNINSDNPNVLPHEIWKMPQLRHVRVSTRFGSGGVHLPHPVATHDHIQTGNFLVLKSLQTLSEVLNFKFTKDVLNRIPNLKELTIRYNTEVDGDMELSNNFVCDLEPLQKLESLRVDAGPLKNIIFPNSLKQLWLFRYRMTQEDMSILGSLQRLESLELIDSIEESEWSPVEGEFLQLKRLHIANTELKCWSADSIHFPVLERLELSDMHSLEEIPLSIGDIQTLQSIELTRCSDSVVNSAKKIWEEQQSFGNENLQVHVKEGSSYFGGVSYQVDSVHATLTAAASKSWINLKQQLEWVQHMPINTKQRETLEEYIHFFRDFVEVDYQTKTQEMESLSAEIIYVGRKFDMCIDSENFEHVMRKAVFLKDKLSAGEGEGEGQGDVQAENSTMADNMNQVGNFKSLRKILISKRRVSLLCLFIFILFFFFFFIHFPLMFLTFYSH